MLMNEHDAAHHDEYVSNYLKTNVPHIIGKERVVQARHKDGRRIDILLTVTETSSDNYNAGSGDSASE